MIPKSLDELDELKEKWQHVRHHSNNTFWRSLKPGQQALLNIVTQADDALHLIRSWRSYLSKKDTYIRHRCQPPDIPTPPEEK